IFDLASFSFQVPMFGFSARHTATETKHNTSANITAFVLMFPPVGKLLDCLSAVILVLRRRLIKLMGEPGRQRSSYAAARAVGAGLVFFMLLGMGFRFWLVVFLGALRIPGILCFFRRLFGRAIAVRGCG